MPQARKISEIEDIILAPYACRSGRTLGRKYPEQEHPYRSCYQRDRDRIVHSAAFRRLEYKTQVFVNHEGDYYRTRLTHTIEVSQIARTIASALGLNADLTEAIALAHDLGHTPFGHSGEDALNELMKGSGGFNHNMQSLRVVDYLEEKYPDFPGLNLTWEVREGIVKHSSAFDKAVVIPELKPRQVPTLETQVVDIADEIAYDNHDLDDGLASGLLKESDLGKLKLWERLEDDLAGKPVAPNKKKYLIIRSLINIQVTDLITQTRANIGKFGIKDQKDVKGSRRKAVCFSKEMLELRKPLREFLMTRLYHHYRVVRMSNKAKRFIQELFRDYVKFPAQLPDDIQRRITADGTKRAVCDYIAAMTDRYALDEYKKLFDPYEKV